MSGLPKKKVARKLAKFCHLSCKMQFGCVAQVLFYLPSSVNNAHNLCKSLNFYKTKSMDANEAVKCVKKHVISGIKVLTCNCIS